MSRLEQRQAELQSRISKIDADIAALDAQFLALAAEFNSADGTASLKSAEQIEQRLMQLRREKAICIASQSHVTREQLREKEQQAEADRRAVQATAKEISSGVITLNDEIDTALIALRQLFERRFALLSQLAATGIVAQEFVVKLQSRAGPTRACCWAGLAKFVSLERVATQSWLALTSANPVLLGIGKEAGPSSSSMPSAGMDVAAHNAIPAPTNGGDLGGIPPNSTNGGEPERRRRWGIGND
jgi:hypothetical protein